MKTLQKDGYTVTTPVGAGSGVDIALMMQCDHEWKTDESTRNTAPNGDTMYIQRCTKQCIAMRTICYPSQGAHE